MAELAEPVVAPLGSTSPAIVPTRAVTGPGDTVDSITRSRSKSSSNCRLPFEFFSKPH